MNPSPLDRDRSFPRDFSLADEWYTDRDVDVSSNKFIFSWNGDLSKEPFVYSVCDGQLRSPEQRSLALPCWRLHEQIGIGSSRLKSDELPVVLLELSASDRGHSSSLARWIRVFRG